MAAKSRQTKKQGAAKAAPKSQPAKRGIKLGMKIPKKWVGNEHKPDVLDQVFAEMAMGLSMAKTAIKLGLDLARLSKVVLLPEHLARYDAAIESRTLHLAEEMLDIADASADAAIAGEKLDSAAVAAAALRVNTRKWMASKMNPRRWGDKLQHEVAPIQVKVTANFGD